MSREDGEADDEKDVCEQRDAGHNPTRKIATIVRLQVYPLRQPSPLKKSLKASTHQTRSAGRPAAPPSPYQSPYEPRLRHAPHSTKPPEREEHKSEVEEPSVRASPLPPPCGSVTPTQSLCAVRDGGDHAYDTQRGAACGRRMGRHECADRDQR